MARYYVGSYRNSHMQEPDGVGDGEGGVGVFSYSLRIEFIPFFIPDRTLEQAS